ncbi:MAG: gamma-glutamyl-gamma-aminobutyrate hydrolase family protein [Pseudomonadota bacterium]
MSDPKRKIGLTMRTVQAEGYDEPRDALAQLWPAFLATALPDADWMYLPNLPADRIVPYCEAWGINALILTGGEDAGRSKLRDESEAALLAWADSCALPVLGICRGLQFMVLAAGGQLEPVADHVAQRHGLTGAYDWQVNSYHGLGVMKLPNTYRALAHAPDGSVEAIQHTTLPWEGWMWHPEREPHFSENDIREIQRIFE